MQLAILISLTLSKSEGVKGLVLCKHFEQLLIHLAFTIKTLTIAWTKVLDLKCASNCFVFMYKDSSKRGKGKSSNNSNVNQGFMYMAQ